MKNTATLQPPPPSSSIVARPFPAQSPVPPGVPDGYVLIPTALFDLFMVWYGKGGQNGRGEEIVTSGTAMGKPLRSHEKLVQDRAVVLHSLKTPMGMSDLEKVTGLPRETLTIDLAVLRSEGRVGRRGTKKHGEYYTLR